MPCANRLAWTVGAELADDGKSTPTLLVIAHPDDETMFFAPALLALARSLELHILCLSTGDFEGLGAVRERELPGACARLGVPPARVRVIDDPVLRDGPRAHWPPALVADLVASELLACHSSRIITFDRHGVSSHPNHTAVYNGVRELMMRRQGRLRVYELRTLGIFRRHLGLIDVALTLIILLASSCWRAIFSTTEARDAGVVCVSLEPWTVHLAMVEHWSQFAWFRRLYVMVSRYVWVNSLTPMEVAADPREAMPCKKMR